MGHAHARDNLPRVGISKLRAFLECRVEECYRRNVAKIVPLLQSELHHAENKLAATDAELKALSMDRLKQAANVYREKFAKELADTIRREYPVLFDAYILNDAVYDQNILSYIQNNSGHIKYELFILH